MGREIKGLFGGGDADSDETHQSRREHREHKDRRDWHDNDDDREARRERRRRQRDFVDRYTTGSPTEGYSAEEAVENFRQVAQKASPETIQRAAQKAMANMTDDQRAEFGKMLEQRRSGTGMVQIERTGAGGSGGPAAPASQGGGDPLSDLFGGLLGGMAGGGAASAPAGGMPDLGGLLGGLLGGGGAPAAQAQAADDGGMFGGLGDFMGSPLGKAAIGGIAAFAMKELLDNDDQ